jgi:hypothetical protein
VSAGGMAMSQGTKSRARCPQIEESRAITLGRTNPAMAGK